MYAVVDIETTGGYASAHGITELAIYIFDGHQVVEKFESLINPGQSIPRYISGLTGISDDMVETAPAFEELAEQVFHLLQDKIFVAHSVNFDYSFLKYALAAAGYELNTKKLCTLRMSRKIVPGLRSYGLGNICAYLGIPIENRHRAGGDAAATVQLLGQLLQRDEEQHILQALKRNSRDYVLPPNVPRKDFDALPSSAGVYYFHDQQGKALYVGKAKNLKKRVSSHFSNNSPQKQKQDFMRHIFAISFEKTGSEMMAALLESQEIKRLWPEFNRSQKGFEQAYGIFNYEDQNGYIHFIVEKQRKWTGSYPLASFSNLAAAYAQLKQLCEEHKLCYRFCHIQQGQGACSGLEVGDCKGACAGKEKVQKYNKRVEAAKASLSEGDSYLVLDRGRTETEVGVVYIERGRVQRVGFADEAIARQEEPTLLLDLLKPVKHNFHLDQIVRYYIDRDALFIIGCEP